jgi:hypothetical protein
MRFTLEGVRARTLPPRRTASRFRVARSCQPTALRPADVMQARDPWSKPVGESDRFNVGAQEAKAQLTHSGGTEARAGTVLLRRHALLGSVRGGPRLGIGLGGI